MILIGLAGQSCAGKNEVARLLENEGFYIIDADKISRSLFNEYEKEIYFLFKDDLKIDSLVDSSIINKKRFSTLLFSNPSLLQKMEDFILPKITREIENKIAVLKEKDENIKIVLNAPTLHKTPLFSMCSLIIYVKANLFIRFFRALKRDGFSPLNIFKRFLSQHNFLSQYLSKKSDILFVTNNSSRAKLENCLKRKLGSIEL